MGLGLSHSESGALADLHQGGVPTLKLCHDLRTFCHGAQILLMHSLVKACDDLLL